MSLHELPADWRHQKRGLSLLWSTCERKKSYPTMSKALVGRDHIPAPQGIEAYKCQFCGAWHLGHSRRKG